MPRIPLRRTQHRHGAVLCRDDDAKIPPRNYFFHRQADSHYASNLNHKLSSVMRIEDKEKPAYLLGYAYANPALWHDFSRAWRAFVRLIQIYRICSHKHRAYSHFPRKNHVLAPKKCSFAHNLHFCLYSNRDFLFITCIFAHDLHFWR